MRNRKWRHAFLPACLDLATAASRASSSADSRKRRWVRNTGMRAELHHRDRRVRLKGRVHPRQIAVGEGEPHPPTGDCYPEWDLAVNQGFVCGPVQCQRYHRRRNRQEDAGILVQRCDQLLVAIPSVVFSQARHPEEVDPPQARAGGERGSLQTRTEPYLERALRVGLDSRRGAVLGTWKCKPKFYTIPTRRASR